MDKLTYAQQFIENGISVIPLHHRNKKPDTSLIGGRWEQYTTILSSYAEAGKWLASGWLNYGVVCGWNNLVVIDFDELFYFDIWQQWMRLQGMGRIAETCFKVVTARGMHVYLQTIEPAENEKRIQKKGGIDVQARGKFVVGPGCMHSSGTQYVAVGGLQLVQVPDVETILPIELFPKIAQNASCGDLDTFHGQAANFTTNHTEYQYDPWQAAMSTNEMDLISAVKSRVKIESLFANVVKTSRDGRWLATLCPFHDDHNPSMWIDTRRQLCGCATCGMRPMDAINLFARMRGIDESAAVRAMAREVGVWK